MTLLPSFFFFNDTATTEIYTLSLHDALPLWPELSTGITDLNMALGEMPADGPHRAWYADNDPVLRLARTLLAGEPESAKRIREIDAKTQGEVKAAVEFAVNSPLPGAETALDFVFA